MSWRRGDKGNISPRVKGTAPKKAPRTYTTHPGMKSFRGQDPKSSVVSRGRRSGMGAKNQDLRAKM